MRIFNNLSKTAIISAIALTPYVSKPLYAQQVEEKTDTFVRQIIPGGITNPDTLKNAPSPKVTVAGKTSNAYIVINTKNNMLYKYDKNGNVKIAYPVATGRPTSPTPLGVYSIGWVEYYPYKTAPESTLRHNVPCIFGDAAIVLYKVNESTGKKSPTGVMVHGCYKDSDVGGNESGGCARMLNPDIINIAYEAKNKSGSFLKVITE